MRCELVRVSRCATELLEQQQQEGGARGVVVVAEEGVLQFEKELSDALVLAAARPTSSSVKHYSLFTGASSSSSTVPTGA